MVRFLDKVGQVSSADLDPLKKVGEYFAKWQ